MTGKITCIFNQTLETIDAMQNSGPVYWASDPERLTGDRYRAGTRRGCSQERFRRTTGFSRAPAVHFATATTEAVSTGIEIRNV